MQYVLEHISEDVEVSFVMQQFKSILNSETAMERSPLQNENFEGAGACFDKCMF